VEVPSIGTPEDDLKTVELKLRQIQKNKGTMQASLLSLTRYRARAQLTGL